VATVQPFFHTLKKSLAVVFRDIRFSAAMVSLLFSAWCVYLDNVVNNDGILYLRGAELIADGNWQGAVALYKWPFYAVLIAAVQPITGLSFEYTAHVLNAAFAAITVVTFISIAREVGGNKKVMVAAAVVVLLYPGFNEYRSFVIRDTGYLAFYLLSLLLFMKDSKAPRTWLTLGWMVAIFVAALFRIEGLVFLFALMLLRLWQQTRSFPVRLALLVGAAFAALMLVSAVAWWTFGSARLPASGAVAQEWGTLIGSLWQSSTAAISGKIETLAGALPNRYARELAYATFLAALLLLLIWHILSTLTPLYGALAAHALYRRLLYPVARMWSIWLWLIGINLLVLCAVLATRLLLTGRLPVPLSLTVMLAVPFSLALLYDSWRQHLSSTGVRRWAFPLIAILLLISGIEGLYSPTEKGHIRDAGLWVRANTSPAATLFSNDPLVLFYANKGLGPPYRRYGWQETLDLISSKGLASYDHVAVRLKRKYGDHEAWLVKQIGSAPIARFVNRKGDKVLIFKVAKESDLDRPRG
jgi:hypothetical protein